MENDEDIKVALLGSVFFEHPVSINKNKSFLDLVDLLRGTSATFANLECSIEGISNWPALGGAMGWLGTHMSAPATMIDDLKFLGIDALYAANNHAADFAEGGILSTVSHLRRGGIPFAGIGASMIEASEPCYVDTPQGRLAMIAAADWGPRQLMELPFPWPSGYLASDERTPFKSRPGINLVRYEAVVHVNEAAFKQLRQISAQLNWEKGKLNRRMGGGRSETLVGPSLLGYEVDTETEFYFMGRKFVLDKEFRISTFPFQEDLDRIYKNIREAREQADVVIMALHDQSHSRGVLDFVRTLAHGSIDSGADIYVNHGGMVRGIEIYRGKPILYGQSGFHMDNDQLRHIPSETLHRVGLNFDSSSSEFVERRRENRSHAEQAGGQGSGPFDDRIVQVVVMDQQGDLKEVQVHPIAQPPRQTGHRVRDSLPGLLEPGNVVADGILQRFKEHCVALGTVFEIRNGVGIAPVKTV